MEQPRRVVWVLGAGFSRPLGGPLLGDLFRPEAWDRLSASYDQAKYPPLYDVECRIAHALFNYGIAFKNGHVATAPGLANGFLRASDGEHIWVDAEAFLASLDTAGLEPKSAAARRIDALIRKVADEASANRASAEEIAGGAKRLIAAECSAFLLGADLDSESWLPFISWAKKLDAMNTIITFNYDRVPELLEQKCNTLAVENPSLEEPCDVARVIKLHGSVNWAYRGSDVFTVERDPNFPFFCDAAELAMATPGPAKKAVNQRMARLWTRALSALSSADAIVFIGYRFPATDALARDKLLGAIRDNQNPYLAVHAVLGPNTQEPDTIRLRELLRMTLWHRQEWSVAMGAGDPRSVSTRRAFNLAIRPCWGEDFLTAFSKKELTDPWLRA